ncbi:hypothetical protein [Streptacidiphilus jiangxiensis]|uniref:N-acetyltransferase domain-containing protein n=1 Tax=Streptacidiphilus jiangxiensis TaxID=235985 RepID=A0A1H7QJ18_STRJI|nr:hypothetical protein [Streptacidiphilus jiangxiensis]SEL47903.1 hypothetical protein SAMN05414137_10948 [Streptacidiphilus jiangxiensis]
MDLSWDRLRPVMRVPYVPTLGPVHADALTPELIADVFAVAGTGRFLPHDLNQRWSGSKDESVVREAVEQGPGRTVIPTLSTLGRGAVKVHYYGAAGDDVPVDELLQLARRLASRADVDRAYVVWCDPDQARPQADATVARLHLKTFRPGEDDPAVEGVDDLRQLPEQVRARFPVFAEQTAADGMAFLWRRFQSDALGGPILTVASGERVVGAIGPLETMKDPAGAVRLLPPHLGVLPDQRGLGHDRALWRAAMHWGQTTGADYQLLLTDLGSPSDTLYQAEGLQTLGYVHTLTAA